MQSPTLDGDLGTGSDAPPLTPVVITRRSLERGSRLDGSDLAVRQIQGAALPDTVENPDELVGAVLTQPLASGQIVSLRGLILPQRRGSGMAFIVPPGKRAYAVSISADSAAGNFIRSGDRVDVTITIPETGRPTDGTGLPAPAMGSDRLSTTMLQDIEILAAGERIETGEGAEAGAYRTATLAVDPEDVPRLQMARDLGTVSLSLRNPGDRQTPAVALARLEDLVADTPRSGAGSVAMPAVLPEPALRSVPQAVPASTGPETIRGGEPDDEAGSHDDTRRTGITIIEAGLERFQPYTTGRTPARRTNDNEQAR